MNRQQHEFARDQHEARQKEERVRQMVNVRLFRLAQAQVEAADVSDR